MTTRDELYAARDAARQRGDKALAREIDLQISNMGFHETTIQDQPPPAEPTPEGAEEPEAEPEPAAPEKTTREAPERTAPPKAKARKPKEE